jgi:CRISPR-associated protein Cas2
VIAVLVVERATPSLRGQLTRWMIEVKAGVFVGSLNARVREQLWLRAIERNQEGGCVLVYEARNEQGFAVLSHGDTSRVLCDFDGLALVRQPAERPPRPE